MRKLLALVSAFAVLAIGNSGAWALGPSFDCSGAQLPAALLVCTSAELARTELALTQTYNALSWQEGPAGAPSLRQEDANFESQTLQQCGVPSDGALPSDAAVLADCMQRAYERQRDVWQARLGGAAAEEATRRLGVHVMLQRALQQSGFLSSSETIDGVYGPSTRAAISAWQHANHRPDTGILSNADAAMLLAGPPAPAAAKPSPFAVSPAAPSAGHHGRANWPGADADDDTGDSLLSLAGLQGMAARYWNRTGSGSLFMALGTVVLIAGFGTMIRAPSQVGGRKGGRVRVSLRPGYARSRYGSGTGRGPQLMVWGLLLALSGACVAYGPETVYQAVAQALTRVFA